MKVAMCASFLPHPLGAPGEVLRNARGSRRSTAGRRSKRTAASRTGLVPLGALAAQSEKRARRAPARGDRPRAEERAGAAPPYNPRSRTPSSSNPT
jgi:hypothetical protein